MRRTVSVISLVFGALLTSVPWGILAMLFICGMSDTVGIMLSLIFGAILWCAGMAMAVSRRDHFFARLIVWSNLIGALILVLSIALLMLWTLKWSGNR